jgi:hypothetical protein
MYATPWPEAVRWGLRSKRTSLRYESEKAIVGGKTMVLKTVSLKRETPTNLGPP